MIRSRLVDRTYAARVFNDGFLQEAGFDQDFFEDFYEETVLRAANADSSEGKRGGVIDSLLEVDRLRSLIREAVKRKRGEARDEIADQFKDEVATLLTDRHVTVTELEGDVIHTTVIVTGDDSLPVAVDPVQRFFTDPAILTQVLPKVAPMLYVGIEQMRVKTVDLDAAKAFVRKRHPDRAQDENWVTRQAGGLLLPSKGIVIKTQVYAYGPTPDPMVYLSLSWTDEPGDKRRVVIQMRSLTEEQQHLYGLPDFGWWKVEMTFLEGTVTLVEVEPGKSSVSFDVKANPGLGVIPNFFIKNRTIGVPGAHILTEAAMGKPD